MPTPHAAAVSPLVRVFISYAHDSAEHEDRVRRFWIFLREHGIDARLDLPAAERRRDWPLWMLQEVRAARFVLVIASPAYRRRAEGDAHPNEGRGVQWEAALIREEVYADRQASLERFLPVVLPGCSTSDIPGWLGPTSTTNYTVHDYTVEGSETLLRLLTNQPYETAPPLGLVPKLSPRATSTPVITAGAEAAELLLRRLADRAQARNEAMVQADVRQLLLVTNLGIDDHDLGVAVTTQVEDRRRIDIRAAFAVIEVRGDLRLEGVVTEAKHGLDEYIRARSQQTGQRYVGLLTDGAEWHLYQRLDERLREAGDLVVDSTSPNVDRLVAWLEAVLATVRSIEPTPEAIRRKLGSGSPAHALDTAELVAIYERHRHLPTVKLKRNLWAKLLTTALGTNFTDEDSLFVDHTLLVAMAEVIGHAVVGFRPDDPGISAATIISGALFAEAQIGGVVEADFFDWIVEVPGGERFIKNLARRLTRFAWGHVEHDVMKVLYESIISPQTRHRLGEYYTPDWLAEYIVDACVNDPLNQRALDASCGSGSFLFHAVRSHLAAAEEAGRSGPDAIRGAVASVIGIDVHPVAVTLARVTYLLAIGVGRLQADDRPAFTVPVYLGDSLRWGQEDTLWPREGLSIPTTVDRDMFVNEPDWAEVEDQLSFPDQVLSDTERFDRLVTELADLATDRKRGSPVPSLSATFHRLAIHQEDRAELQQTLTTMCELHDQDRDHIWGYYIRNLARPVWLARPNNRIDVLVGNPPWLAYRYMTVRQQESFRAMSKARGLWAGATVATNQDLSALFVARCIELYLRPGGQFGYVMPLATLSRRQYKRFCDGHYPVEAEHVKIAFDPPWDLHRIKPSFFPLPASVVFGRRLHGDESPVAISQLSEIWTGRFRTSSASRADAEPHIIRLPSEPRVEPRQGSPYSARFAQGATVVPRLLFVVEPAPTGPLGVGAGRQTVRSRRSANEKMPWRGLPTLEGTVERQFIRPLYAGDSILPFRCLKPINAIIPWDGQRLLDENDERLDLYPGLAKWWRKAESTWTQNRSSERLGLLAQLDYRGKLSQQFGATDHRIVYTKSGMYLAAAILIDSRAVVDHKLYWGSTASRDEARFLTAILNSTTLTMAVRPLQARGEHNPRDFDKYIFQLPIPLYDPHDTSHKWLVALAERSERVAAAVTLPNIRFEAQRRRIREALSADGVAADIDEIVKTLLA